ERNPGPADNIPIWQVAQATTAAPTYFDQITISNKTFGDGGLGTNNPVEEIFWEVSTMHGNDSSVVDLLVSIGTGQADPVPFYNSGPWKIQSFINATKALATDSEKKHEYMEALLENTGLSEHMMYQRFNVQREKGLKNMKLDEWKEKGKYRVTKWGIKKREQSTLEKITEITGEYCKQPEVQEEIRKVAKRLVQNRLDRCTVERKWEQWTTG
ncbi:FabD/lysophospholipase-like protein, partial [Corynespora cassiicola Philippines]